MTSVIYMYMRPHLVAQAQYYIMLEELSVSHKKNVVTTAVVDPGILVTGF